MKLCKECGKLMGYNSYFSGYYCTSCGKIEAERKSSRPAVRAQLKWKNKGVSGKTVACSK